MLTNIHTTDTREYRALCGAVAAAMPTLKWRHNGLGLLQAYMLEGEERELRVHVWAPTLRRTGIEDSGLLHDHRFNLLSHVLVGGIRQQELVLTEAVDGTHQLHTVTHARAAVGRHAPNDGLVLPLQGPRYNVVAHTSSIAAGESYWFPKRAFHGTFPETDLTITLVTKLDQDEVPARILAPYGKEVVHAFAEPLPEASWEAVLLEARVQLLRRWRRL